MILVLKWGARVKNRNQETVCNRSVMKMWAGSINKYMREIRAGFQESLAKKLPGMRTEDTKYLFSPSQLRDISVDLKFTPNCTQKEKKRRRVSAVPYLSSIFTTGIHT